MAARKRTRRAGNAGKHEPVTAASKPSPRGRQRRLSDAELKQEIARARAAEKGMSDRDIADVLREAVRARNGKVARQAAKEIKRRSSWGLYDVARFGTFSRDVHEFLAG